MDTVREDEEEEDADANVDEDPDGPPPCSSEEANSTFAPSASSHSSADGDALLAPAPGIAAEGTRSHNDDDGTQGTPARPAPVELHYDAELDNAEDGVDAMD